MSIIIPSVFRELVLPNRTEEEQKRFTPQYKEDLRKRLLRGEEIEESDLGVRTFIIDGGRISGKTTTDEAATVPLFFEKERGDIWYCRSEENTIRRSIFQSMQDTIYKMGFTISNGTKTHFKVSSSPFEITCNFTGNKMQFLAINKDINRTKAMFPPSGKLKKVMLEEANEPDGSIYVEALRSTALRYMDEKSKIVFRYNPPPSLNHWANIYYQQKVRSGATRIHPRWDDIAQLLDPVVIADILKMKREDPLHYAYWYGGEIVSLAGRVIWSFDKEKHTMPLVELLKRITKNLYYQPSYMFYGVDSGVTSDATAVSAWGLFPDGKLIKLDTLYIDIRKEMRYNGIKGMANTDQLQRIIDWHAAFKKEFANYGIIIPSENAERWCFDGAGITQDLMNEMIKSTWWNCIAVTNKDIERDIARLINSYRSGQLCILDTPNNQVSINQIENFVRNEENEIPDGQEDHTIDADKYATYEYYYNFFM